MTGHDGMPIQVGSTFALLSAAIEGGHTLECADRAAQLLAESEEARALFPAFVDRARIFLQSKLDSQLLFEEESRLAALLAMPDGSPFSMDRAWPAFAKGLDEVQGAAEEGNIEQALRLLDRDARCVADDP